MIDGIGSHFKGYGPFLLRLGLSFIMILEGARRVDGLGASPGFGRVAAAAACLLGGLFILIGLFTRWAAFALGVFLLYQIFTYHHFQVLSSDSHRIWWAALMMTLSLYCLGGGDMSVDARNKKKEK